MKQNYDDMASSDEISLAIKIRVPVFPFTSGLVNNMHSKIRVSKTGNLKGASLPCLCTEQEPYIKKLGIM